LQTSLHKTELGDLSHNGHPLEATEPVEQATAPLLSIVVPTKDERDNVAALVERLEAALPTVALEVIFVDDSTDGTAELVEELAVESERDLVVLPQERQRRICGLGAAVVQGIRAARAPWVCVMDADLQHPPELIAALLEQGESRDIDIVVASRYSADGDANAFGWARAWRRARRRRRPACSSRAGSRMSTIP
jgi:dolichol-phosphate mannosyltransferase